jgi:hypothetical protein
VAEAATQPRPVATLHLAFELTAGEKKVTPPRRLAMALRGTKEEALLELRAQLDATAHKAFPSCQVFVDGPRFSEFQEGKVTGILGIFTRDTEPMSVERLAGGLTWLADEARGPFEAYFRKVTDNKDLKVVVTRAGVTQEVARQLQPQQSLTGEERIKARWIAVAMLVLVALFVLVVLEILSSGIAVVILVAFALFALVLRGILSRDRVLTVRRVT